MTPEEARERFALDGDTVYRYAQYADAPPDGSVLTVEVLRWSGWAA